MKFNRGFNAEKFTKLFNMRNVMRTYNVFADEDPNGGGTNPTPNPSQSQTAPVNFEQLIAKANSDYEVYIRQRSQDEVSLNTCTFTEDEFNEILEVNSDIEGEINGIKMSAADILEAVYVLFVK